MAAAKNLSCACEMSISDDSDIYYHPDNAENGASFARS